MSQTTESFDSLADYILERYKNTFKKAGDPDPLINKSDLCAIFNAAAVLSVASAIRDATTGN